MHPKCIITINGTPVSGLFWEKLIRVDITDREGSRSDTIELELEDGPPHIAIPQDGDLIQAWLGYEETGVEYMGAYKIADVDVDILPWKIKVRGEAADMTAPLKEHRERHWDDATLKDIVGDVAKDAGLTPQVAGSLGSFKYKWWGQQNASGLHMLEDLAARHNALFTIKDGKLIFAERGSGQTPGGASLAALVVVPTMIVKGTCQVSFQKRTKHKDVSAEHYDRDDAKRKRETEKGEDKTEAGYTLRHGFGSKDEAKRAAKSRSKYLKREGVRTAVEIEGNPTAKAGRPMTYAGCRPGVDGIQFVIEEAKHSFSKGRSYRTGLKGKLKDGESGEGGDGASSGPSED